VKSSRCNTSWQTAQVWNPWSPGCQATSPNREIPAMLVRPRVQNAPGKNGELSPSGYSLHQGSATFFALRTSLKLKFFRGPAFKKSQMFSNEYLLKLVWVIITLIQWEPWTCFAATRRSHLGIVELNDTHSDNRKRGTDWMCPSRPVCFTVSSLLVPSQKI